MTSYFLMFKSLFKIFCMCLWYNIMSVFMAYNKYTWYSVIRSHNFIAAWKARLYSVWKVSLDSNSSSLQDDGITYGDSDIFNHASRSRYTPTTGTALTLLCDVFYSFLKSVSRKKKQSCKHSWYLKKVKSSIEKSRWGSVSRITCKCLFIISKSIKLNLN